jgi:hypothetical protein
MSRTSQVIRSTRETVSLDTLEKKLPPECYDALVNHLEKGPKSNLDDDIYRQYFEAKPTPVLNDDEKKELFETLGAQFVKGHFSTEELRSYIEREPSQKRAR